MPLTRIWGMLSHWSKHPPMHRLFAMFVGYGEGDTSAPAKKKGFEITSAMLDAFGGPNRRVCRQSQLDNRTRKSVEGFQSTPAYKSWRESMKGKVK